MSNVPLGRLVNMISNRVMMLWKWSSEERRDSSLCGAALNRGGLAPQRSATGSSDHMLGMFGVELSMLH